MTWTRTIWLQAKWNHVFRTSLRFWDVTQCRFVSNCGQHCLALEDGTVILSRYVVTTNLHCVTSQKSEDSFTVRRQPETTRLSWFLIKIKNYSLSSINFDSRYRCFRDFDVIYAIDIIFPRDFQYTDGRILCHVFVTFSGMSNIAISFEFYVPWYLHNVGVIYK